MKLLSLLLLFFCNTANAQQLLTPASPISQYLHQFPLSEDQSFNFSHTGCIILYNLVKDPMLLNEDSLQHESDKFDRLIRKVGGAAIADYLIYIMYIGQLSDRNLRVSGYKRGERRIAFLENFHPDTIMPSSSLLAVKLLKQLGPNKYVRHQDSTSIIFHIIRGNTARQYAQLHSKKDAIRFLRDYTQEKLYYYKFITICYQDQLHGTGWATTYPVSDLVEESFQEFYKKCDSDIRGLDRGK
ncbi:hypothetical protein [Chitinophaga arvensicola]|uniref:Uncharacterized protein n=1 Tax=Chitinophaga arvensicola TaxID=29529 RepID=A0A1I0PR33_9BACT|nr:hypothetical protein [Chitinophaga arvensicola]SEW16824.1 hypothetical protein SAMN04488122_0924 [Chitinophaga arvensicola]